MVEGHGPTGSNAPLDAQWAIGALEVTDAFGRVVPITLRYNTGFLDAAVRASVADCVTFFWRFEDDPLMGAGGPDPEMEAGLAAMEAAITDAIPGDGGSLVAVRLGNGMVEYAVAFFTEAAHEALPRASSRPKPSSTNSPRSSSPTATSSGPNTCRRALKPRAEPCAWCSWAHRPLRSKRCGR